MGVFHDRNAQTLEVFKRMNDALDGTSRGKAMEAILELLEVGLIEWILSGEEKTEHTDELLLEINRSLVRAIEYGRERRGGSASSRKH